MNIDLIYCCFPNKKSARICAKLIIEKKLSNCCNLSKSSSIYFDNNKINTSQEIKLIIKSKQENSELIEKLIEKYHPYKTAVIITIPAKINQKALNWLNS